jgi:uncharacterized protein with PQ loop repeat
MFEGIILIIFLIVGGLAALLALFFFIVGLVRQSKTMFKTGLAIVVVPLSFFALTYWFYRIHIPNLNRQQEQEYVGIYVLVSSNNSYDMSNAYTQQPRLVLNADNTFQLDKNDFTAFYGKGTWKAGATDDGQFEFKDSKNSIIFWATPSNNNKLEIDSNFSGRQKAVFVK